MLPNVGPGPGAPPIMPSMHLVVPYAGASFPGAARGAAEAPVSVLPPLPRLPHLQSLLDALSPVVRDEADELSLSPPHERAEARLRGWSGVDGLWPFAAHAARGDGLAPTPGGPGWGLLSPTYWHLGTDRVSLVDPATLRLDDAASRALFDALAPLFDGDGWALHWGAPTRWYAVHDSLASLPTASLDRVVSRNVDLWLDTHPQAAAVRRLQVEAQMLLYTHPVNDARVAAGLAPVNSFWLSGTGRPAAAEPAGAEPIEIAAPLRGPALAADAAAWADAWRALDAGPLRDALAHLRAGGTLSLTLCGERHAQRFGAPQRPAWRRWLGPSRGVAAWLAAL